MDGQTKGQPFPFKAAKQDSSLLLLLGLERKTFSKQNQESVEIAGPFRLTQDTPYKRPWLSTF
jgi:hypothetical protein